MFKPKFEIFFIIFLLISRLGSGRSQEIQSGDRINYQIGFGQNLNSYRWQTAIRLQQPVLTGGFLTVGENFKSSLIRVNRLDDKWRDDQQLKIGLRYPLRPFWGIKFLAQSNRLNDRISGLVSDIRTNFAVVGFYAEILSRIRLDAAAGYKYDRRLSKTDRGLTYQVEMSTDTLNWGGYRNSLTALTNEDRFPERKNSNLNLTYRVKKYFQRETYDSLTVFFVQQRRDNYDRFVPVGLFLESLSENIKGVQHFLSYGVGRHSRVNIRTELKLRASRVDKKFKQQLVDERSKDEFHLGNEIGIIMNSHLTDFNFTFGYATDNQKSQAPDSVLASKFSKYFYYISPDFQSSRVSLSLFSRFKFSRRDTLTLKAAINKFQYDTPETNMDDRDELRLNFQVGHVHHFSDQFKISLNASANLYHLVYIFSERSANNNWMRIFRIFPRIVYQPTPNFRVVQTAEVLANYVDYDYEIANSLTDVRSYVFRRFMIDHNIEWKFLPAISASIDYKFEIEENGKFSWDRWTEIVLTNRQNHWIRAKLSYQPNEHLTIAPGMIYFRRDVKNGESFLIRSFVGSGRDGFLSYGPVLSLHYHPDQKLIFFLEAMRRAIEKYAGQRQFINFLNLGLNWRY
ncbi:MAG: hypothetical protein GXO74_04075 [Calditrichaeota bacterium]|nr:hypothetical protein [Calditrichota bacterium]